jgi:uncharacterized Zn finger protein
MSRRANGWDDWPPRAKPRRVEGGVKAQTKRGAFGQRWWAKRWIAVLESFGLGTRLTRGRAYARGGQVVEIALESGGVRAGVQGSRPEPYTVTIRLRELSACEWRAVGAAISANTRLAAMLLAGEMPEDIESAFAAAGTPLFPKSEKDLKTSCSCPDWSNPCKHVAAVFYLIGEEFDRDPFQLFLVRGLPRAAVRDLLSPPEPMPARPAKSNVNRQLVNGELGSGQIANDGLASDGGLPRAAAALAPPTVDAMLLREAGRFPFWRAAEELEEALAPVYARATETALAWLAEHRES